jgi:hypothetical protein
LAISQFFVINDLVLLKGPIVINIKQSFVTKNKYKICILVTDGVSLRNFAYTNFYKKGIELGYDVVFWNTTVFNLEKLGFKQEVIKNKKLHWLISILKNTRTRIELNCFIKRYNDGIYKKYIFPLSYSTFIKAIKSSVIIILSALFNSENGLRFIRKRINTLERRTRYYKECKSFLEVHKPDVVYCTSQRSVLAIAPIQAAQQLNIPTIGFIYSWDNLPKATLDVTTNFYHVWSNYMKDELLKYHPFISNNQVKVTGTPQFESHYDSDKIIPKEQFYKQFKLKTSITYICFSGDDVTTSPKDELYLRDLAQSVKQLNKEGLQLGIIFRRCPVDFSNRYDEVINEFNTIIVPIEPVWKPIGKVWNTIMPTIDDTILLASLAKHCAFVVNLGSSMVFDFAIHNKPCMYVNYNYLNAENSLTKGVYVYDFVHFRSKPSENVVVWLNHPDEISKKIKTLLNDDFTVLNASQKWFSIINKQIANKASERIWDEINSLVLNLG